MKKEFDSEAENFDTLAETDAFAEETAAETSEDDAVAEENVAEVTDNLAITSDSSAGETEDDAGETEDDAGEDENAAEEDSTEEDDGTISFADLGLDEETLAAIEKKGFVNPSPIQVLAIPRLLTGDANVIARARTGTGKTAAFGLPLVQSLRAESEAVKAVILEPTRELAMQTASEMASFTSGRFPRTAVVYGGASMGEQIRALKKGVEIVVGTPGRVQDLMERGVLDISKIEFFILDEGDEMLDMGFVDDIENIFSQANPNCRVLLFSATIPSPILKIAQKFMGDYEIVEEEGVVEEPLLIDQKYWFVRENEKIEALVRLIDISDDFYGLVFVQKKTDADYVAKALDEKGYEVAALHGDIPQGQREKILSRFRNGKTRILVATDVAARGIDIEGLTHVVNYDLPFDGPTYVHRIGRTGRAGSSGVAVTFVKPEERRKLQFLKNAILRSAKGEMIEEKIPSVEKVLDAKKNRLFDELKNKLGFDKNSCDKNSADENFDEKISADEKFAKQNISDEEKSSENSALNLENSEKSAENAENFGKPTESFGEKSTVNSSNQQKSAETSKNPQKSENNFFENLAQELCEGKNATDVLASLLCATYGNVLSKNRYGKISSYNDRSDKNGRFARDSKSRGGKKLSLGENQMRVYIQLGWRDGYNPKRISAFLCSVLGIRNRDVDAIDMADKFCLVSLPKDAGRRAIEMSQKDSKMPHIHQDTKVDFEVKVSRTDRGSRGERGRNFSFDNERSARGFSRDRNRDFEKGRSSGKRFASSKKSNARTGVHTATQRNSQAALFKKSKSASEY